MVMGRLGWTEASGMDWGAGDGVGRGNGVPGACCGQKPLGLAGPWPPALAPHPLSHPPAHLSPTGPPPRRPRPRRGPGLGPGQPVRQPQAGSGAGEPTPPGALRSEGNARVPRLPGRGNPPRAPGCTQI